MARFELNDDLKGVEIYFDSMPDESIRNEMKAINFRWHRVKKCWYAKQNEDTMALAKKVCGESEAAPKAAKPAAAKTAAVKTVEPIMNGRCCYSNYVDGFYKESESDFIKSMKAAFNDEYVLSLGPEQVAAWKDCFKVMQDMVMNPEDGIIFEYALPYESGRRPDVLLISNEHVVILEFKMKNKIDPEEVLQAAKYVPYLEILFGPGYEVIPVLVLTRGREMFDFVPIGEADMVLPVCSGDMLFNVFDEYLGFLAR